MNRDWPGVAIRRPYVLGALFAAAWIAGCDVNSKEPTSRSTRESLAPAAQLSAPIGLAGRVAQPAQVALEWQHPSGNAVEVEGYRVFRDGKLLAVTAKPWFRDAGVAPGQVRVYTVASFNSQGDESDKSAPLTVRIPPPSNDKIIVIKPDDDYSKIESAAPGDTVLISPGVYRFRVNLTRQGTAESPIVIRALDPANRPVFDYTSTKHNVAGWPGSYLGSDAFRSAWRVTGAYYTIDGIVIQGANNAFNGWTINDNTAGIRYLNSKNLIVRNCRLYNNDMGIQGGGSDTLIEYTELDRNGNPTSDQSHNLYVLGADNFALQFSSSHDSRGGQNFHIRARQATLAYNWFQNAAAYEGDMMTNQRNYDPLADGKQKMLLVGNILVQNSKPANGNKLITLYNDAGEPNPTMSLTALSNVFVFRDATKSSMSAVVQFGAGVLSGGTVRFSNNVVTGINPRSAVMSGIGRGVPTVEGRRNFFMTGSYVGPLKETMFGRDPGFIDPAGGDFRPRPGSVASNILKEVDLSKRWGPDGSNQGFPLP